MINWNQWVIYNVWIRTESHIIGRASWANVTKFQCHLPKSGLIQGSFLPIEEIKEEPFLSSWGTHAKGSAKYGQLSQKGWSLNFLPNW